MTKKADILAALVQLKHVISQSRDGAINMISRQVAIVTDGGDFAPLPVAERAPRRPMKPMISKPEPAPAPEPEPETADDGVDTEPQAEGVTDPEPEVA